ncbi:MAG TPA: hypothetical protein VFI02_14045 [Armatimonadota bacterium]|nr:hypothetical protein [Armatimonadota bacterium]
MMLSLENMIQSTAPHGIEIGWSRMSGPLLPQMRDEMSILALEKKYTHLLFIDADMMFPPHGLVRLLNREVDIVSGMYFKKTPPYTPLAARCNDKGQPQLIQEWEDDVLLDDIDRVGAGFLLIKTEVFEKMQRPRFMCYFDKWEEINHEDWYFCKKARQLGFKIHLDTGLQLGHVGPYIYSQHAFLLYKKMIKHMKHPELGLAGAAPSPPAPDDINVREPDSDIDVVAPDIQVVKG